MDTSRRSLAAFVRGSRRQDILEAWDRVAVRLHRESGLPQPLLRDDIEAVLDRVAEEIETIGDAPSSRHQTAESLAVDAHVLQRAETGVTIVVVSEEIMALGDAIEAEWPCRQDPTARETLVALRHSIDRLVLATIERFYEIRMRLLDTIDAIVRQYPGESLEKTLQDILRALFKSIDWIDTAAMLLREGDHLHARAAIGLEEEVRSHFKLAIGRGFAGGIAAERKPRLLHCAMSDPLIANPVIRNAGIRALYGVPLIHGDELLGVAHMGSRSADDFSSDAKALFRMAMDRAAGILYQALLLDRIAQQEARYRAITENAPTIIFSKDLAGRYSSINQRALEQLGLAPSQFIGRTDFDVFPDDTARELQETDRRVIETRATMKREQVIPVEGGRRTYLAVKFPIVDEAGRLSGVGGVATDITERRRHQLGQELLATVGGVIASSLDQDETLSTALSCVIPTLADCCIVDLSEDGSIRRVAVHHRDPAKAELARKLLRFPIDGRRPSLGSAVLHHHEPVFMPEVSALYLDGIAQSEEHRRVLAELDPTSMIQVPLLARGHLLGVWNFLRCGSTTRYDRIDLDLAGEVGWRASLAVDNAKLYQEAQRANRARQEVLGMVAHDLRNPLGGILGAAQRIAGSVARNEGDVSRPLDILIRSANRMTKLVSDLLDEHAIETGQISVDTERIAAGTLVRDSLEAQRSRLEAAALSVQTQIADELPDVFADRDRIHQVFDNLIGNAVKFTPRDGRVVIGARTADGVVCFFVSDTGPGIPADMLPHVFERFWRARRADRLGVGLGLAICKGIVEAHGGRIWAASEPGRGATVYFTLPQATRWGEGRAHAGPAH